MTYNSPESYTPNEIRIPESEISFEFMRSGGKGGQNVNKVSSAVRIYWSINASVVLSPDQKSMLIATFSNTSRLIDNADWHNCLVIKSQSSRDQFQNRQRAIEILHKIVNEALTPRKERVAKLSKSVKRKIKAKRKNIKTHLARKKAERKKPTAHEE